jgi:hypothetical protein
LKAVNRNTGLSLLEMSIVLIIIGLVVGSVLVGRDMVVTSQIRTIESEATAYQSAFQTFYGKYGYLPGDMPGDKASQSFPGQAWLGGNNDGQIIWTGEGAEAWRQMVLANLATGVSNTTCAASCYADPGDTIPRSKAFTNAGWTIMYDTHFYRNILLYGAKSSTDFMASTPVLTAAQASAIDTKFDDNIPDKGTIISINMTGYPDCFDLEKYNVQATDIACNFSIALGK